MPDSIRHYIIGGAPGALAGNASDASPFFWLSELAQDASTIDTPYMAAGHEGALRSLTNDTALNPTWALGTAVLDWPGLGASETDAVWMSPETSIQYNAPSKPYPGSTRSPLDTVLTLIDAVQSSAPGTSIAIYEDWADPTPFLVNGALTTVTRKVYFDYVLGDYHRWFETLVSELQTARPDLSITLIPAASTVSDLVVSGGFPELATTLMPNNPGDGASARALLTGAVSYISAYEMPLSEASLDIDPALGATFAELSKAAPETPDTPPDTEEEPETPETPVDPEEGPEDPPGPTTFTGTDAADVLSWTDTLELVDLGDGLDTVVVAATRESTTIQFAEDGAILMAPPGQDTPTVLHNVERLAFEDGTLAFDTDGLAGQAYRLYQASFDRTPDAEGLGFWIDQLDAGNVTLTKAAEFFMTSEEFAAAYGTPEKVTDVLFLTLLYVNALNRMPDEDGFIYWREQQKLGLTRPEMMVYFSESPENTAQVAPAIDDGIWYL